MNILFLFFKPIIPSVGGVERVTHVLTKEFLHRGNNVYFLCTNYKEIVDCDYEFIAPQFKLRSSNDFAYLKEIIKTYKINIVINQDFTEFSAKLLLSLPVEVKKISVFHSLPFATYLNERNILKRWHPKSVQGYLFKYIGIASPKLARKYYLGNTKKLFEALIDASDKYCLLSDRFIPRMVKLLPGIDKNKIVAINNPNTFDDTIKCDESLKKNVILFVGRIENISKNAIDFVKLWQLLYEQNPNWKAIVVGDGSDLKMLIHYAEKHRIRNIKFVGHSSSVDEYYKIADFLCVTSIYEGWGMSLTEGMVWGCIPICYGSYESVYDIVEDNVCGYITTPYDLNEMAQKIQMLILDRNKRLEFSVKASEHVKNFSVDKIADKWENLFINIK